MTNDRCEMCGKQRQGEAINHMSAEDDGLETAVVCDPCYRELAVYMATLTPTEIAQMRKEAFEAEHRMRN